MRRRAYTQAIPDSPEAAHVRAPWPEDPNGSTAPGRPSTSREGSPAPDRRPGALESAAETVSEAFAAAGDDVVRFVEGTKEAARAKAALMRAWWDIEGAALMQASVASAANSLKQEAREAAEVTGASAAMSAAAGYIGETPAFRRMDRRLRSIGGRVVRRKEAMRTRLHDATIVAATQALAPAMEKVEALLRDLLCDAEMPRIVDRAVTGFVHNLADSIEEEIADALSHRLLRERPDPRLHEDFGLEGQKGFFACGAHAAIQWEQVARIMQLHVLRMARLSRGPEAYCNTPQGSPDCTRVPRARPVGQLVYYYQAADRFNHPQDRQRHLEALRFVNLSKSAGLHGMCPVYIGMRVRLTRKVLAPELVQEASGEVINILFHKDERFGDPASSSIRPADAHPCWERG